MAEIIWVHDNFNVPPGVGTIIDTLADALLMSKVFVEINGAGEYRLCFEENDLYFELHKPWMKSVNDCTISLDLCPRGTCLWEYRKDGVSLDDFAMELAANRANGFESKESDVPILWSGHMRSMNEQRRIHTYLSMSLPVEQAVLTILDCLDEDEVCLVSGIGGTYELRFSDDKPKIKLVDVGERRQDVLWFIMYIEHDGKNVWHKSFMHMTPRQFESVLKVCAADGFMTNNVKWKWGTPVTMYETDKVREEEAETVVAVEKPAIYGVVPDDITSVRVVALKYEGAVVAFRFKTDKGTFDISSEVAEKLGLSGSKTAKFINLINVNGLLMSESEKQDAKCVQDVSSNEADCRRLMTAIFRT